MSQPELWALPLARYLAHSLWQGGVILLGYRTLLPSLRGAAPAVRHRLALSALLLLVLLPLLTALATAPAAPVVAPRAGAGPLAATSVFHWSRELSRFLSGPAALVVTGAWLLGILFSLARNAVGAAALRRLVGRARTIELPGSARLAALAGLGGPPRLAESGAVLAPCVAGWRHPVVLVPAGLAESLAPEQLRAVLLHEFAHLRRRDPAIHLMLRLFGALAWYQPWRRRLERDLEQERELCCDELAVRLTGRPVALAEALVRLEERRRGRPRLVLAGTGGDLGRRIRRLLSLREGSAARTGTLRAILSMAGMALVAGGSALVAGAAEADLVSLARLAHARIHAQDPAGPFTVELVGERLVAATIGGEVVPANRIVQQGRRVRLLGPEGSTALTLDVPGPGEIRWDPRPPPGS